MHGRKLWKAGEKVEELRKKCSSEKEIPGEATRELKDRLSRLVSSDGSVWVELRSLLKEIAEDLKGKTGRKH